MSDLTQRLRLALRTAGAARSAELQDLSGASQASVSRALAPLLEAGEALRVGRARTQAYVMPRPVDGIGTTPTIRVMKVDEDGAVSPFGVLIPVTGGRCWMEEVEEGLSELHGGLPWFLADMKPDGFLGRSFVHAHPQLQLAPNPTDWNDDDTLKALCQVGEDLPGNLIAGDQSFDRLMHAPPAPRVRPAEYPALASAAMSGALPGSSAGGEQPKFCTVRDDGQPVIVKFSPAGTSPAQQRWGDLLVCEHLALRSLHEAGVPAAHSRITRAEGRTFLEVERFDRTPQGRIGMVSMRSFDNEYIGQIDNWAATAERMRTRGLLPDADTHRLVFLEAFGRLIANTDRHYGNISLLIDNGNWRIAPAYDMLPMHYAPTAGEIVEREFNPGAMAPTPQTLEVWVRARGLARQYWMTVAAEPLISDPFRAMAAEHARQLEGPAQVRRPAEAEQVFQRDRPS
jgi:hypothetical protein